MQPLLTSQSTPVLSDLLALVGERQSASANLSEALATTEALKSATKRYSQLRAAEDALWSGHGANQSTLELVRVDPTTSTSSKIEAEIIVRLVS